jgi:hypothetical protein
MEHLKKKLMIISVGSLLAFGTATLYQEDLTAQVMKIPCEEFFNQQILDCD